MPGSFSLLKIYCTIFLLMLFAAACKAQRILVLDRDGHSKRIRFKIHDQLAVRFNNMWTYGAIDDMTDSSIFLSGNTIKLSEISAIRFGSQTGGASLLRQISIKFPIAAIAFLGIGAINAVINKDYPVYSKGQLTTAGALLLSGPVAYFFTFHKNKINARHRLKIIDVSIR